MTELETGTLLHLGESLPSKGGLARVTPLDIESLPRARIALIALARGGGTTTYRGFKEAAALPHAVNGLGRLLDLVGHDCARRAEPNLASLVVTSATGDVGAEYDGDSQQEREAIFLHWAESGESVFGEAVPALVRESVPAPRKLSRPNPGIANAPVAAVAEPVRMAAPTGVTFCGLDLAWSQRNASGIAVVDGAGRLLASAVVTTDDEIAGWLAPHLDHVQVVAVDAPLVVPNETGRRPVEAELSAAYQSAYAGALPSNRGNPLFDPPRGARLADRFGWRIGTARPVADGESPPSCIEVYPHPAMVGLFGLDRVIPYKARGKRSVEDRRIALGVLMTHLEAIEPLALGTHARWLSLRRVQAATVRPVDLKRLEDELDGIFCAHLAWLWGTGSTALRVWGDEETGFIVAPERVGVADQVPMPHVGGHDRPMTVSSSKAQGVGPAPERRTYLTLEGALKDFTWWHPANRRRILELIEPADYSELYRPSNSDYLALKPRSGGPLVKIYYGYIVGLTDSATGQDVIELPINRLRDGNGPTSPLDNPRAACPVCFMELPVSGVCGQCD